MAVAPSVLHTLFETSNIYVNKFAKDACKWATHFELITSDNASRYIDSIKTATYANTWLTIIPDAENLASETAALPQKISDSFEDEVCLSTISSCAFKVLSPYGKTLGLFLADLKYLGDLSFGPFEPLVAGMLATSCIMKDSFGMVTDVFLIATAATTHEIAMACFKFAEHTSNNVLSLAATIGLAAPITILAATTIKHISKFIINFNKDFEARSIDLSRNSKIINII